MLRCVLAVCLCSFLTAVGCSSATVDAVPDSAPQTESETTQEPSPDSRGGDSADNGTSTPVGTVEIGGSVNDFTGEVPAVDLEIETPDIDLEQLDPQLELPPVELELNTTEG